MKTFKNNKGFTLIELLAVIVVLAIVIAIATTTVLPSMTDARKYTFSNEANAAIETASNIINLYDLGLLTPPSAGDDYQKGTSKYCFSLKYMSTTGYLKKDTKFFDGEDPEYAGKVVVDTSTGGTTGRYVYTVTMHNDLYAIKGVTGTTDKKNVETYKSDTTSYKCSSTDVS